MLIMLGAEEELARRVAILGSETLFMLHHLVPLKGGEEELILGPLVGLLLLE